MFVVDFIKFSCLGLIIPKRNVELDFFKLFFKTSDDDTDIHIVEE